MVNTITLPKIELKRRGEKMCKSYVMGIGGIPNPDRQEDDYYATPPRAIDDLLYCD